MLLLSATALLTSTAVAANCSDYLNGVIDGFAGDIAPSQLKIDRNCTIRNFPASNPLPTNFSFFTNPGQTDQRWLVIFDNVVHTGQMACNSVAGHRIWFTNGSSTTIKEGCQNLLIPVEKINKQTPAGTTTATVGVPFTYTLTWPVLFDPATDTVIDNSGSPNDLHGVTIRDDLDATGVDLSYVDHVVYRKSDGAPVPHTFSNVANVVTFDSFPIVPAGEQIVIEMTVVLEDTANNTVGTEFVNTAKWDFGRLIDGTFYSTLPGEWGISPPLTIAGPELVLSKSGPGALNLSEPGVFTIDVSNVGTSDAWDVTVVDELPGSANGGMCDYPPSVVAARVFGADGISTVPGKPPLVEGSDFEFDFDQPGCQFTLTTYTPQAAIGPGEHLLVTYHAQLDDDTANGATLTNVAAAVQWFNGSSGNSTRQRYTRELTDGTVGVVDHEDAHTLTAALTGLYFEKIVANLSSGADPASSAAPGDLLRYTLRIRTTDTPLIGVRVYDDLGELNGAPVFTPGTLQLVPGTVPAGADARNTDPWGGTNSAGIVDIRDITLAANTEVNIQFDIRLSTAQQDATVVLNQALMASVEGLLAVSDDPHINGQANPDISGDEDPTRIVVQTEPPAALVKTATQPTAAIGEPFRYTITIPGTPHATPLYDVRILDDLGTAGAALELLSVARVGGTGNWTPVNTGSTTNLVLEDPTNGIDIPAGEQVVIEITVRLVDVPENQSGLSFNNTASYTFNQLDNDNGTQAPGDAGSSAAMSVVAPDLVFDKSGPLQMRAGESGSFTLDVHNVGSSTAFDVRIEDVLPDLPAGGMCTTPPAITSIGVFTADGITPLSGSLSEGADYVAAFTGAPECRLTIDLVSDKARPAANQRLIVRYAATLDADTPQDMELTNIAGATRWRSWADPGVARTDNRSLSDGTISIVDHEDAHTVVAFDAQLRFEKTVVNLTSGDDPAAQATPGDWLRYSLLVENVGLTPLDMLEVVDELDRLNPTPAFAPSTLTVVSAPAGADVSATDAAGGADGTGFLHISNLQLSGPGDSFTIVFDVQLQSALANGRQVQNQARLLRGSGVIANSDDPNVNGPADPDLDGDEDPTRVSIVSSPALVIEKTSSYPDSADPVLLAGDRLRYRITVHNNGTEHADGVVLADTVPTHTHYEPGTTHLNGVTVADGLNGSLPLAPGLSINGVLSQPGQLEVGDTATIEFEVRVDDATPEGTLISNQGFVSATGHGISQQPSDDPATPAVNDPTTDVVGNLPLLFASKSVELSVDGSTPGQVDPGDILTYSIEVFNNGSAAANAVSLTDQVPQHSSYMADTLRINGLPGAPDDGVFPLAAGVDISSSDLTPPLPAAGQGVITPGSSAVVQFDMRVDAGVAAGTLISNQAVVGLAEGLDVLTDGDGNPATGPEPTVVVVGNVQQLSISKEVSVVGGGAALPGSMLEYTLRITNIGSVAATDVLISDDIDQASPGALAYVSDSATMNGFDNGVVFAGSVLTADYGATYGALEGGETVTVRFRVVTDTSLADGATVRNIGMVSWDTPARTESAEASIDIGAIPGMARLAGAVWHDASHDRSYDGNELALPEWTVALLRDGQPLRSVLTDEQGRFEFAAVAPNADTGSLYAIRFIGPGAGPDTAMLGVAHSPFNDGMQQIDAIVVGPGANQSQLNLPVDPNGVVYDSVARSPLSGARVTMLNAASGEPLPDSCFDDPNQQGQVTLGHGYYKFDLNFSQAACPNGADYRVTVMPPDDRYVDGISELIPPTVSNANVAFDVPACPGSPEDAVPGTATFCEAQPSELAPDPAVPPRSARTRYYNLLKLSSVARPASAQLFNNHLPLDPRLGGAIAISKTTPMLNVSRGQMVPYTITIRNTFNIELQGIRLIDRFPPGLRYVPGSAQLDGSNVEPQLAGDELHWSDLSLSGDAERELRLLLAVGAGVGEGEYVNRAQVVLAATGTPLSQLAAATVRVVPDPTFDCSDLTGKVFDDRNRNGLQEPGEPGIPGVRLVTASGLAATTDGYGRYHVSCAMTPHDARGSNVLVKLDDRTLPSGFRTTTRLAQVHRATRGKALQVNFAASIHHVVGLDIADAVFEPGSTVMRQQWRPRLELLLQELEKRPAVLRLSYLADVEAEKLVKRRVRLLRSDILEAWQQRNPQHELIVETEVFWRLGDPARKVLGRSK